MSDNVTNRDETLQQQQPQTASGASQVNTGRGLQSRGQAATNDGGATATPHQHRNRRHRESNHAVHPAWRSAHNRSGYANRHSAPNGQSGSQSNNNRQCSSFQRDNGRGNQQPTRTADAFRQDRADQREGGSPPSGGSTGEQQLRRNRRNRRRVDARDQRAQHQTGGSSAGVTDGEDIVPAAELLGARRWTDMARDGGGGGHDIEVAGTVIADGLPHVGQANGPARGNVNGENVPGTADGGIQAPPADNARDQPGQESGVGAQTGPGNGDDLGRPDFRATRVELSTNSDTWRVDRESGPWIVFNSRVGDKRTDWIRIAQLLIFFIVTSSVAIIATPRGAFTLAAAAFLLCAAYFYFTRRTLMFWVYTQNTPCETHYTHDMRADVMTNAKIRFQDPKYVRYTVTTHLLTMSSTFMGFWRGEERMDRLIERALGPGETWADQQARIRLEDLVSDGTLVRRSSIKSKDDFLVSHTMLWQTNTLHSMDPYFTPRTMLESMQVRMLRDKSSNIDASMLAENVASNTLWVGYARCSHLRRRDRARQCNVPQ